MAEYEKNKTSSDEWYTPPEIFHALNLSFDLDPCHHGNIECSHWVPTDNFYTKEDNGLLQPWYGLVFMNPPFGGRNSHLPWLDRFIEHGNGIAIVRAYTSAAWFHSHATLADAMLFPLGKTKFVRPDGSVGGSPGHGIVLLAMGDESVAALKYSDLGFFVNNRMF